jgi:hypothetical protein
MNFKDQIDKLQKLFTDALHSWNVRVKIKNISETDLSCAVFFELWGNDIFLELLYSPKLQAWRLDYADVGVWVSNYAEVWMLVAAEMQTVIKLQEQKINELEHI